jgi:hypothetical protein
MTEPDVARLRELIKLHRFLTSDERQELESGLSWALDRIAALEQQRDEVRDGYLERGRNLAAAHDELERLRTAAQAQEEENDHD